MRLRAYDGGPVMPARDGEYLVAKTEDFHAKLPANAQMQGYQALVILAPHGFTKCGFWPVDFNVFIVDREEGCDVRKDSFLGGD